MLPNNNPEFYLMKIIVPFLICFLFATQTFSQAQYTILKDDNHPEQHILLGIIDKYIVQKDSAYKWYNSSLSSYKPDSAIVLTFEKAKGKVQFIVFGGTWCEDTQFVLPKFFKLQEMSGVPDNSITFFGVDRSKKSLSNIADALNIKNVPTIIVLKNGKELGRVVEYGTTGKWDKELAAIISSN